MGDFVLDGLSLKGHHKGLLTLRTMHSLTVGVLALQGAFLEHLVLLRKAAAAKYPARKFQLIEVRNTGDLERCDALIIPGGESTTLSLVAARSGLLEQLRAFVKIDRKPVWGTCAGLIMLAEAANATKKGGQELIGGLDVRVHRNHFGRQIESFEADLALPFLTSNPSTPFPAIFIRAPIVDKLLPHVEGAQTTEAGVKDTVVAPSHAPRDDAAAGRAADHVEVLAVLPGRLNRGGIETAAGSEAGDIVAVRQGNVFGTSFHPELTQDTRIHEWWLEQVVAATSS